MKKALVLSVPALLVTAFAIAAVTVGSPTSLVTSTTEVKASSAQVPLFSFLLTQDAGETLNSVKVNVANSGGSTAVSDDIASVSVYKDDGDGNFETNGDDLLAGSQTTVNLGSATVITTGSNNAIGNNTKFFVTLATDATWSDSGEDDALTVTLPADAITTSANSPTISAVTTSVISADTTGPVLQTAVAMNGVGGTAAKEAGDKIVLTFNEATNKPVITAANINTVLALNNSHSWLDGVASISGASWNATGTELTITLSGGTSVPTIALADVVAVSGSVITDVSGNSATGSVAVTGSFGTVDSTGPALSSAVAVLESGVKKINLTFNEATNKAAITAANIASVLVLNNSHSWLDGASAIGSATWNDAGTVLTVTLSNGTSAPTIAVGDTVTITGSVIKDATGNNATGTQTITGSFSTPVNNESGKCGNGLTNGRLYKTGSDQTVYLAAACKLKPFRGAAVFHARGHKFQNIITLSSTAGIEVSTQPALPAGGTLVQGSDKTVWFVTKGEKRRGFVSENSFKRLGFSFGAVKKISDTDLQTMSVDSPIQETENHPEGTVGKCGNSATVFEIIGNSRFPFANPDAFLNRGHGWDHIATVDCGRFAYTTGTVQTE